MPCYSTVLVSTPSSFCRRITFHMVQDRLFRRKHASDSVTRPALSALYINASHGVVFPVTSLCLVKESWQGDPMLI